MKGRQQFQVSRFHSTLVGFLRLPRSSTTFVKAACPMKLRKASTRGATCSSSRVRWIGFGLKKRFNSAATVA